MPAATWPQHISDLEYQWMLAARAFQRCKKMEEGGSAGDHVDAHLDAFACVATLQVTIDRLDEARRARVCAADERGLVGLLGNVANGFKHADLDRWPVQNPGSGHGVTVRLGEPPERRSSYHPHYDLDGVGIGALELASGVIQLLVEHADLALPSRAVH
jgi:hypothetical protein